MTNPELTIPIIISLKEKVNNDTIEIKDLENIDYFLASRGAGENYILNNLKKMGYESYAQFILEKKTLPLLRNKSVHNILKGVILGGLEVLQDFLIS